MADNTSLIKVAQIAVVGLGEFGVRYLNSLTQIDGARVRWVCGLDPERVEQTRARFAVPHATADFQEICGDPAVDAVIVVTPESAHAAIAVAALDAGKHVLVEKPLATSVLDARAMIEAEQRSGKLLMTAFLLRFDYRYAQLRQRLDRIDPIRSVYAYRNFDRSLFQLYGRTHSFVENAIHDIDLLQWYVRSSVARVHGFCRNTLGLDNPDVNVGVLEFENGVIATLQSTCLYPPQPHERLQWNAGIHVMGDRGVLEVANDQSGFRGNIEGEGITLLDQTGWATIHDEPRGAFGAMLRHCVRCIRGETAYAGTPSHEAMESVSIAQRLIEDAARREGSS